MTNLLMKALNAINSRVNVRTGLSHPLDECAVKEMFIMLYKEGEILDATEIYSWASQNGWDTDNAKQLSKLAEKIATGRKVQIRYKNRWRKDIIEKFKEDIKE